MTVTNALAAVGSLAAALLLRWLLADDPTPATDPAGGTLYDPARGEFPDPHSPCLVLRRTWQGGELLVISTSRPDPLRDETVIERTWPVPLTPRCRCCTDWRRSPN